MASLLDQIDRFSYTAQTIKTAAQNVAATAASPYVRAILTTPLGDLARDVDSSELGLFTLVSQAGAAATALTANSDILGDEAGISAAHKSAVTRVEFLGATPLRRPPPGSRALEKEKEPEVYAEAALKYLDRYHSIRPMPRARQEVESLLERLTALRSEISQLTEAVDTTIQAAEPAAPTARDEEKRVQELNLRIKQMKARKDVLLKKQKASPIPDQPESSKDKDEAEFWASPAPAPRKRPGRARQSIAMQPLPGPGAGPRMSLGLAEDSMLLSEHMDTGALGGMLGDVSMDSMLEMPTPVPIPRPRPAPGALASAAAGRRPASDEAGRNKILARSRAPMLEKRPAEVEVEMAGLETPTPAPLAHSLVSSPPTKRLRLQDARDENDIVMQDVAALVPATDEDGGNGIEDGDETMGEDTIVLAKPPRIDTPSAPPVPAPISSSSVLATEEPEARMEPHAPPKTPPRQEVTSTILVTTPGPAPVPTPGGGTAVSATPGTARKSRFQITADVERIVAKIWTTVGDVIMPGHPFSIAAAATTNKPPRAKETIALLQNLSTQRPSPTSPSISHSTFSLATTGAASTSSAPTAHQILTAHLLLTLLTSTPSRTLPLSQAKSALTALGLGGSAPEGSTLSVLGGGQALEMRALYGCVTKRLIKIDRTGREQTVRFDV